MITVRHLLKMKGNELWTIPAKSTVFKALELLAEKNIGALPVVDKEGQLAGIFSERDYARKVILKGKSSHNTQVNELMTSRVYHVKPTRSIQDCMQLMTDKRIRHLPVIDKGQLIGIVTIGDIVKAVIESQAHMIHNLEGYISGAMHI